MLCFAYETANNWFMNNLMILKNKKVVLMATHLLIGLLFFIKSFKKVKTCINLKKILINTNILVSNLFYRTSSKKERKIKVWKTYLYR